MTDLRERIVAEARATIGTAFAHQGRSGTLGLDCVGLVIHVARQLALVPAGFDFNGYPGIPDGRTLLAEGDRLMQRIHIDAMRPGDVAVIAWKQYPQHLGIVGDYLYGGLSLIHAYSGPGGGGKVIEHRMAPTIMEKLVSAYRLPGVPA